MIFVIFFVIFIKVNEILATDLSEDTLEEEYGPIKYAALIFRHGQRIPLSFYPKDPYENHAWPVDVGEMTNEGKELEYEVGKYFKPRYSCLSGDGYQRTRVVMHSSDVDRCLMSGELFLAGYFPPLESETWNKHLPWHPVPVHTTTLQYDNVVALSKSCPQRDVVVKNFYETSPVMQDICAKYSQEIDYIQIHTGLDMSVCASKQTVKHLVQVQDILLVESQFKLELPEWTHKVFPEPLTYLRGVFMNLDVEDFNVAKFKAGPLLSVIASDMVNIAGLENNIPKNIYSNDEYKRSLHLFSAHDITIVTLMRALKMYQNVNPPYGAALGFELRAKDNSYYVTAVYESSLSEPLQVLEIPGCPDNCTLENFLALITSLIPQDWDLECQIDGTTSTPTTTQPSP